MLAATLAALLSFAPHATERLALDLDTTTGQYTVLVDGAPWFKSGPTAFTKDHRTKSTADGSLKLSSRPGGKPAFASGSGQDALGKFESTVLVWSEADSATPLNDFTTSFKNYKDLGGRGAAIVFEQYFPNGVDGTTLNASDPYSARDGVSTMFPSFVPAAGLGYLAFAGDMTGSGFKHGTNVSTIPSGVSGTGPVCFFDKKLDAAVVISPFSQFMAASAAHARDGSLAYGVQGSITAFPRGYSLSFVLSLESRFQAAAVGCGHAGVNSAFEFWGDLLLQTYGKSREVTYGDYGLRYLAYSTDNGAYYYYQTEDGLPGKRGPPYKGNVTYQDTLIDTKAYAATEGIPYRYILLDSWWYYQGKGSGVSNWVSRPDVFPDGNAYVRNATGWPIMGHNRYWAVDNIYARQNGGSYDFVMEKKGEGQGFKDFSWPSEQHFWDDLMYNSSQWGLFMYEQDWLDTEYDNVMHLNLNATAARTWLLQMGSAAAKHGLTIQYCMSHCRHILQSVEIPAVTNARASGDYHPGNEQWQPLGNTAIFAWAVGIAPTKDNFWSTDVQTGSAYGDYKTIKEPYNRLQAAVSTLTKGPVAPSDKIGSSDASLIMRSCAMDGTLLQGDKPAMAIDAQHVQAAFSCAESACGPTGEVWATYTALSGVPPFAVVLSANLHESYALALSSLALGTAWAAVDWIGYEANSTTTLLPISSSDKATAKIHLTKSGKWDFQVWALAPWDRLASGFALLGEQDKWVPVSAARFSRLEFSRTFGAGSTGDYEQKGSVMAKGTFGERIQVTWAWGDEVGANAAPLQRHTISCTFPQSGTMRVSIIYGAKPSVGKAFHGYCDGEYVYGPLLTA